MSKGMSSYTKYLPQFVIRMLCVRSHGPEKPTWQTFTLFVSPLLFGAVSVYVHNVLNNVFIYLIQKKIHVTQQSPLCIMVKTQHRTTFSIPKNEQTILIHNQEKLMLTGIVIVRSAVHFVINVILKQNIGIIFYIILSFNHTT